MPAPIRVLQARCLSHRVNHLVFVDGLSIDHPYARDCPGAAAKKATHGVATTSATRCPWVEPLNDVSGVCDVYMEVQGGDGVFGDGVFDALYLFVT